jgi:hypothetical protein
MKSYPGTDLSIAGHSVHLGRVESMKVHRVGHLRGIDQFDPDPIAFRCPDRGTTHSSVVRPGWKEDPCCDLDLFVEHLDLVLPDHPAGGILGDFTPIEVGQNDRRIKAVSAVVHRAHARDRGHLAHRLS